MMKEQRKSNLFRIILLNLMIEIFNQYRLNTNVIFLQDISLTQMIQFFVVKCLMKKGIYVVKCLKKKGIQKFIKEFIQGKSHIHANTVSRVLVQLETRMTTREDIRKTNLIFVIFLITAHQNIIANISSLNTNLSSIIFNNSDIEKIKIQIIVIIHS